jgi:hypothetical protein
MQRLSEGLLVLPDFGQCIQSSVEILWYSGTAEAPLSFGEGTQIVQHKLVMPHPNECGPEKTI